MQPNKIYNNDLIKTIQGFNITFLNPGESKEIEIELRKRNFSSWDLSKNDWNIKYKEYDILIGSSSREIKLIERISL